MRKLTQLGVLALALVLATGLIGASSFTTATLTRDASIDVVSDTNGFIGLSDQLNGDIVTENGDGALTIDFAQGSATGVNVNSTYELGDPDDPQNTRAFSITNNDGVTHTINMSYTVDGDPGDGAAHNATEFQVYFADDGSSLAVISEDDTGAEFTLDAGKSADVIVIIDTTDGAITDTDDLSGTLSITAT